MASNSTMTSGPFAHILEITTTIHFDFMAYVEPCLSALALAANLITTIIFLQVDAAKNLGPNVRMYYLLIAVFDIISILDFRVIVSFLSYGVSYATNGEVTLLLVRTNDLSCKLSYYLYHVAEQWSGYTFVLFSIERACALYMPLRSRTMFSYRRAKLYTACLCVVIVLFNVHLLVSIELVEFTTYKDCRSNGYGILASLYFFTTGDVDYGIPFVLILIVNCLSVFKIRMASKRRLELGGQLRKEARESSGKENSALSTVLLLSASHCIIFLPVTVFQTWNALNYANIIPADPDFVIVIDQLAWSAFHLAALGKIVNFIIYYTKVPYFKHKLLSAFTCCKKCPS